jgi:hypothetical protein
MTEKPKTSPQGTQEPQDRLDELGEQIQEARQTAEEAVGLPSPEEDQLFYESGDVRPEDDDQTPVPPG